MSKLVLAFLLIVGYADCNPCLRVESIDVTSADVFANGSIVHDGIEYKKEVWYEVEEDGEKLRFGCPCIGRICLWRCCQPGEIFEDRNCTSSDLPEVNPFSPSVYNGRELTNVNAADHFFYMYNRLCEERYLVDTMLNNEELYIQEVRLSNYV